MAGRKQRIDDDLTWRERRMRRNLGTMAAGERRGERVFVRYGRIMIEGGRGSLGKGG